MLPTIVGLSSEQVQRLVANWERLLPEHNMVNLLGPFYSPCFSFCPRPPLPDLEERIVRALFWKSISGVRVLRNNDADALFIINWLELGLNSGHIFAADLMDQFNARYANDVIRLAVKKPRSRLFRAVHRVGNLVSRLGRRFWNERDLVLPNDIDPDDVGYIWTGYAHTLKYAAGFLAADISQGDFGPLLGLLQRGNLILGYDDQNRVLVRCE